VIDNRVITTFHHPFWQIKVTVMISSYSKFSLHYNNRHSRYNAHNWFLSSSAANVCDEITENSWCIIITFKGSLELLQSQKLKFLVGSYSHVEIFMFTEIVRYWEQEGWIHKRSFTRLCHDHIPANYISTRNGSSRGVPIQGKYIILWNA